MLIVVSVSQTALYYTRFITGLLYTVESIRGLDVQLLTAKSILILHVSDKSQGESLYNVIPLRSFTDNPVCNVRRQLQ